MVLLGVDPGERILKQCAETLRRIAPDGRDQKCIRSLDTPQQRVAKPQAVETSFAHAGKRVPHEILDRSEHPGDELRILRRQPLRCHMLEQEAGMLMDQKDVLYAVDQSVREHHVREGGAGPVGFEAPLQSLEGEAVLQHLVQGADRAFQGFSDGLADRRPHKGVEDIDQRSRVPLDGHLRGALDNGSERLAQPLIARSCLQDGGSEDSAHRSRELLGILESLLKLAQRGTFATGDDVAQLLEARIGREARHPGCKILIQTPRQINQERCEPLPVDPGLVRFQVRERKRGIGHGKPSSLPLLGAVHAGTGSRRLLAP